MLMERNEKTVEKPQAQNRLPEKFSVRLVSLGYKDGGERAVDVSSEDIQSLASKLCSRINGVCEKPLSDAVMGALREIAENFIHAGSTPCSVVLINGDPTTLIFSDGGPGIPDKKRALEPGYTTATAALRQHIQGVGLGLFRANSIISEAGGELSISDNLSGGTVFKLSLPHKAKKHPAASPPFKKEAPPSRVPELSQRQNDILFLLTEAGSAGPSYIATELKMSVSTAHRELVYLNQLGLTGSLPSGKKFLTGHGRAYLQNLLSL